jgi:hypothetical protein
MSAYKSKGTEQIFMKFNNGIFYAAEIQAISFFIRRAVLITTSHEFLHA